MAASRLWLALLITTGCSVSVTKFTPCDANSECRDAFGFGWECGAEGYCDTIVPHPRCTETFPQDLYERQEFYGDHIVVGTLMNHQDSRPYMEAVELAAFLVSDDFSVGSFAMIHCRTEEDLGVDALTGAAAVQEPALWLADNVGIPALVGPDFSSSTVSAFEVLDDYDVFMISPSATSEELTYIDGTEKTDETPGQFWRTAPPDSLQARVIASDMQSRNITSVGVIHSNGSYGNGLAASFRENFAGEVLEKSFGTDGERDDAIFELGSDPTIQEIVFIAPQVVDNVALIANASENPAFVDTIGLFLTDGGAQQKLLTDTVLYTDVYPRIRGTRPASPSGELWGYFVTSYLNHYGKDPLNDAYSAYAHDAGWLTLYAAAASKLQEGKVTGQGMSSAMRRMSDGVEIPLRRGTWEAGLQSLTDFGTIDVVGSSGLLDYDPNTEETFAPIDVWTIAMDVDEWVLDTAYTVTE